MNFTGQQDIPDELKKEVKDMLTPYFTKKYSNEVRNPVLLLNFLHQHSLISKPVYEVHSDTSKPNLFMGSCSLGPLNPEDSVISVAVGPHKTEVEAGSKKECRNKAAQKILNLLLGNEETDITKNCDNQECPIELGIQTISIAGNEDSGNQNETKSKQDSINFYEDDLTGILLFDDVKLKEWKPRARKKKKKLRSNLLSGGVILADPQCGNEFILNSSCIENKNTNAASSKCQTKNDKLTGSSQLKIGDTECVTQSNSSMSDSVHTRSTENTERTKFGEQITPVIKSARLSSSVTRSHHSSSSRTDSSSSSSSQSSLFGDNLYIDFFDPFSRLRPKVKGHHASQKESSETEITNSEWDSNNETMHSKLIGETCQNNKTPFQILQEKAVKNFKLIPRSRIDKTDTGFSCTLILDTHSGYGEGRTKKQAKLKAATSLLELLENQS